MQLLLCHHDSYLREVEVQVLSCVRYEDGFAVATDRSIAFPGGGGQPADTTTIAGQVVHGYLEQDHGSPLLLVDVTVPLGTAAMAIDWSRRFDHMQQHSAQHIITAMASRLFGWETLAFHLNPERSDVVLDVRSPPWSDVLQLESAVNEVIRSGIGVTEKSVNRSDLEEYGARYRRLPGGEGALRVIDIDGVDMNPCGGTHVSSTAHIQLVKIIAAETDKGHVRLQFLAGERALRHYETLNAREKQLTMLMSEPGMKHVDGVSRLQRQLSRSRKRYEAAEAELGTAWVRASATDVSFHWQCRPEADNAFLSAVSKTAEAERAQSVFLVIVGTEGQDGRFSLMGPETVLGPVAACLLKALGGRGGGRGRRRQGKVEHTALTPTLLERLNLEIKRAKA